MGACKALHAGSNPALPSMTTYVVRTTIEEIGTFIVEADSPDDAWDKVANEEYDDMIDTDYVRVTGVRENATITES